MTTQAPVEHQTVVIVTGNPVDGFRFIGPVETNTAACEDITDRVLHGAEWWYAPLTSASDVLSETDDENEEVTAARWNHHRAADGAPCDYSDQGADLRDFGPEDTCPNGCPDSRLGGHRIH